MASNWVRLGIALLATGCMATVETVPLNAAPRPMVARPARAVEIYASSPPVRPHVDVAMLRADQPNYDDNTTGLVQALAERAGAMGCDALFISGAAERSGGKPGDLYYLLDPGSRVLLGVCVVYVDQPGTPAPPPAPTASAVVLAKPAPSAP